MMFFHDISFQKTALFYSNIQYLMPETFETATLHIINNAFERHYQGEPKDAKKIYQTSISKQMNLDEIEVGKKIYSMIPSKSTDYVSHIYDMLFFLTYLLVIDNLVGESAKK